MPAALFTTAIAAFGIETLLCAHVSSARAGYGYHTVPVIPWPLALPWVAYLLGSSWLACAAGMLSARTARLAALLFAAAFVACTLVFVVPHYAAHPMSISLRTRVFEPLAIAALAWIAYEPAAQYVTALCLAVFGVDHFLALHAIAGLVPAWIPWHVFWVAVFGAAMIAAGIAFAAGFWNMASAVRLRAAAPLRVRAE